jgi:hypothetical protein
MISFSFVEDLAVRPRKRRRSRATRARSLAVFVISAALAAMGVLLYAVFDDVLALLLSLGALATFVVAAWRGAHPEEGGNVGHPDISPWGV